MLASVQWLLRVLFKEIRMAQEPRNPCSTPYSIIQHLSMPLFQNVEPENVQMEPNKCQCLIQTAWSFLQIILSRAEMTKLSTGVNRCQPSISPCLCCALPRSFRRKRAGLPTTNAGQLLAIEMKRGEKWVRLVFVCNLDSTQINQDLRKNNLQFEQSPTRISSSRNMFFTPDLVIALWYFHFQVNLSAKVYGPWACGPGPDFSSAETGAWKLPGASTALLPEARGCLIGQLSCRIHQNWCWEASEPCRCLVWKSEIE